MTIQQCKYILKIAECGSLNEAAKQLFIAQSSLSVSVKSLEQELNIQIFQRAGNGVYLTESGAEFLQYARQIVAQSDFIADRYRENNRSGHLYIATQHYDFVADIFSKLLSETTEPQFRFSLREMQTHDVIQATQTATCHIGILAIKDRDHIIMQRYIQKRGLSFTPLLKAMPHVYLRKDHPIAKSSRITKEALGQYPYVSYDQGTHSSTFFAEEIVDTCSARQVQISDRATLMNVLLATDCYTIGTGIMPSLLNEGRIISIPFESEDFYTIGYLLPTGKDASPLTKKFIEKLHDSVGHFTP